MDEMTPGISCMANEAFLGYYKCVIEGSTHEGCSDWSCADIGVSTLSGSDTADTSTDIGGTAELTGITVSSDFGFTRSPSAAPVATTNDDEGGACVAEVTECQEDSVCVDCSGVVTAETEAEWDSCLNSVFTEDLCTAYGRLVFAADSSRRECAAALTDDFGTAPTVILCYT